MSLEENLCYLRYMEVVRRTDFPSQDSYQMCFRKMAISREVRVRLGYSIRKEEEEEQQHYDYNDEEEEDELLNKPKNLIC